jgi:hypothetical protein
MAAMLTRGVTVLLARRVVGTAGPAEPPLQHGGCDCSLEGLYVLRAARGKGAGSARA